MEHKTGSIFDISILGPADTSHTQLPGLGFNAILNNTTTKDDLNKMRSDLHSDISNIGRNNTDSKMKKYVNDCVTQ